MFNMDDGWGRGLGEFISGLRRLVGKTQEELAEDSGLSVRSISDLERGRVARPHRRSLELLAAALNLDPVHAKAFVAITRRASSTCQMLAEELGVTTRTELSELYRRILEVQVGRIPCQSSESGVFSAGAPHQLPMATRYFVGRKAELASLNEVLPGTGERREPEITVVSGTAGVGKTALALYWAHQVVQQFDDGQLYVNLRGFGPTSTPVAAEDAVRTLLEALGVQTHRIPPDLDASAALYRSLLVGRRILIVLDNARDEQQIRPLLPGGPGCLVIATSRNQLSGLIAAEGARQLVLGVLSSVEARQLFSARMADRFATEQAAVDEVTRLCGRVPLAVVMAAAYATAHPCLAIADLAAALGDDRMRLDVLDSGDPSLDVRAVLSWSVQRLGPEAGRIFCLLGLHPGPEFTASASISLAALTPSAGVRAFRELSAANVISESVPGRYNFYDLMRIYAADRVRSINAKSRRAASIRMLDHYLHTACAAAMMLNPAREQISLAPAAPGVMPETLSDHREALAWFDAEYRVLAASVMQAAGAGFDASAWRLSWAMDDYLRRRGRWNTLSAIEREALASVIRLGDVAGEAVTRRHLGRTCALLCDYSQADDHLRKCLQLCENLGDHTMWALLHLDFCDLLERQGRPSEALMYAERCLNYSEAANYEFGQFAALGDKGRLHASLGDYGQALGYCREALARSEGLGVLGGEAAVWDTLGYVESCRGEFADAIACYERSLDLFRENGDRCNEAAVLKRLSDSFHAAGEIQRSGQLWRWALDIMEDLGCADGDEARQRIS